MIGKTSIQHANQNKQGNSTIKTCMDGHFVGLSAQTSRFELHNAQHSTMKKPQEQSILSNSLLALQVGFIAFFISSTTYDTQDFQPIHCFSRHHGHAVARVFGYLLTFLKSYGLGAVGFTMLLTVLAMQLNVGMEYGMRAALALAKDTVGMVVVVEWPTTSHHDELDGCRICCGMLLTVLAMQLNVGMEYGMRAALALAKDTVGMVVVVEWPTTSHHDELDGCRICCGNLAHFIWCIDWTRIATANDCLDLESSLVLCM
jgi:hypothetical protein